MDLDKYKHFYFIGIGGVGVSAIARMMLAKGKKVSGSDQSESPITKDLESLGIAVKIGTNPSTLPEDVDFVIYTIAIPENHPELLEAKKRGISCATYPATLGIISQNMKTVAVSGTHGKTTTTAMIAKILIEAEMSPTVIVGSLLREYKSNFVSGQSDIFVVEACEYRRSFLNLTPHVVVITNIDADHLDYYKDIADIQSAFRELIEKMGEGDFVVCDSNAKNISEVISGAKARIVDYTKVSIEGLNLMVPGSHNISNARAAIAVAEIFNAKREKIISGINKFSGTWRRFEYKGETPGGALVYDDYAHHPTEIRATLQGAKSMSPDKKIIAIFQPHLFSRTKDLLKEFSESFDLADEIIIAPIYASREKDDGSINHKMLANAILEKGKKAKAVSSLAEVASEIKNFKKDSIVITLGAGDIYKAALTALDL